MRRAYVDPVEEDLTGQAGWMYTDLLLALMVIFLATISFVPKFMGSGSAAPSDPNYSYSKVIDENMNVVYENFNVALIESDVRKFKSSHNLPTEAHIVFAQYVGGYSADHENSAIAIARALAFSQKLDKLDHQLLETAATTLSSSNVLTANQVIVRFTFATTEKLNN